MSSTQDWKLGTGIARVFPASDQGITRPLVLAAPGGEGATDLDAFQARVFPRSYSFGDAAVGGRDYDLVLVGYNDGNAALADQAKAVQGAVFQAIAQQIGGIPLSVGGVGRGALAARYALASMEQQRVRHQTANYFSYNGTAPSAEEGAALERLGGWPVIPVKLKLVTSDFASELNDDDFNYNTVGDPDPGGRLITSPHGSWLLDRLDERTR